ncbi:MAG: imidazoleglycerol-phosphate dehydratase [Nitrososphaeraceae archaeon]
MIEESRHERIGETTRTTKETNIKVTVNLDGSGKANTSTGLPFINHLIDSLARHSMVDINVLANSNDNIVHHLIEDTAISLSRALDKALSDRKHIFRFGYAIVPMDDSLTIASIDLVRRQYSKISLSLISDKIEGIYKEDIEHFVRSLAENLNACVHIEVRYGENDHHKVESVIKALAIAFRMAINFDPRSQGVASTKGEM